MPSYLLKADCRPGHKNRYWGLVILLAFSSGLQAASPVRPDTFEWVDLLEQDNRLIVTVHFRFPIMYQWHYPQSAGNTLLVQMKHIPLRTRPGVSRPRPFKPLEYGLIPPNEYIESVSFEHNDPWNGLLNIQFTGNVAYRVYPTDLRKLVIEIDTAKTTHHKPDKKQQP